MKNKIEDLRNHLFATLEALQDPDKPMDIARAKAVADVAQTIINSATVEVKYMQTTGAKSGSGFITEQGEDRPALPGAGGGGSGGGTMVVHKIK